MSFRIVIKAIFGLGSVVHHLFYLPLKCHAVMRVMMRNIPIRVALFLLASLLGIQESLAQWETPPSGTAEDLHTAAFITSATVTAMGDNGTADRSTDAGQTWTITASGVSLTNEDIADLVFLNATTAVGVGTNGVILRSTDGGTAWSVLNSGVTQDLNAIHFSGATVVAVGQKAGAASTIIRSTDSGANWTAATISNDPGEHLTDVAFISATVAIAVGEAGTMLRSADSGANWAPVTGPVTTRDMNDVAFVTATTIVGVGKNGTILRSTDGGVTWSLPTSPTGNHLGAIHFSGSTVVAVGDRAGGASTIIYSTDSGANWNSGTVAADPGQHLNDVTVINATTVVAVGQRQKDVASTILQSADSGANWTVRTVAADPIQNLNGVGFNGSTVIAVGRKEGGNSTVFRSTDSGASWARVTAGTLPNQHLNDVTFISAAIVAAVGNNGAIARSTNGGANWTTPASPTGNDLTAIHFSGSTVIAVGDRAGGASTIAYSTDSGASWNSGTVAADPNRDLFDVTVLSATTALAVGQATGGASTLLRTTNSGANWSVQTVADDPREDLHAVHFSGSTIIAVGDEGTVAQSTDSGANWAIVPSPGTTNDLHAVHFSGSTLVAVGQRGGGTSTIVHSTDSGANWAARTVTGDPNQHLNDVTFVSATIAVAVGNNGAIVRSTDGGASWNAPTSPTGERLNTVHSSGSTVVAVGQVGGTSTIVRSTNGGASWTSGTVAADPLRHLTDVTVLSATTALAVGQATGGASTILRTTNGGANWTVHSISSDLGESLNAVCFNGSTVVSVGDNGAVVQSTDSGATWAVRPTPFPTSVLNAVDANGSTVIAVGNDAGGNSTLLRSTDSGVTWTIQSVTADPGKDLNDIVFVSASTVIAVGDDDGPVSVVLQSTDGGITWNNRTVSGDIDKDLYAVAASGATVIAVGQKDGDGGPSNINQSTDSGASWTYRTITGDPNKDLNDVAFLTSSTLIAVGNAGTIVRSTDGGATWGVVGSGVTASDLNDVAVDATRVLAVGDAGAIVRSVDSGATWAVVGAAVTANDLNDVVFNSITGLAVGSFGTIVRSTDGGATWATETSSTANDLNDVIFNTGAAIAVGNNGTIRRSEPSIGASPSSLSFGNVDIGSSSALALTVNNTAGSGPLIVTSITSTDGHFVPDITSFIVAAGGSQVVDVTFTPTAIGAKSGTLIITHNDPLASSITNVSMSATATSPIIGMAPPALNFGDVLITTPSLLTVTISNTGNKTLTVSSITSDDGQFVPNPTSFSLAQGGSQVVDVTFTPTAIGARSANLTINHDDMVTGSPSTVAVDGNGINPIIGIAPSPLTFGDVLIATPSILALTVSNTGTTNLVVTSITSDDGQFVPGITSFTVAPSGNQIVNITFTPTATGARSGTLSIIHNATTGSTTVPISGNGINPISGVAPSPLTFGDVLITAPSLSLPLTVSNTGTTNLVVTNIASDDGRFVPDVTSFTVAPSGSQVVNVTFTPSSIGARSGNLTINHNAAAGSTTVPMSGSGINPISGVAPASLTYGDVLITTPSALPLTVSNTGTTNLVVTGITSDDGQFVPDITSFTVTPGGNQIVNLTFTPTAIGARSGTLSITHNAAASPTTLSMSGNGINPIIGASPASLSFGNVQVGTPSSLPLTISNTGTTNLVVTGITSDDGQFVPDITSFTVTPGGNQIVNLTFTPTAIGARSGTLSITHNAAASPTTLSMSGNGTIPGVSISPDSLNFGKVVINASAPLTLTISNPGSLPLNVTNITSDDGQFVVNITSFSVAAGGSQVVNITYTPTIPGSRSSSLSISHSAAGSPTIVPMTGDATVGIAPASQSLSFGSTPFGSNSSLPLTVTNPSAVPITITSITSDNPVFVPSLTTFTIAAGGSQVVDVSFNPTGPGFFSATLAITHNPTILVALSGGGLPGPLAGQQSPGSKRLPPFEVPFGGETLLGLLVCGYGLFALSRRH